MVLHNKGELWDWKEELSRGKGEYEWCQPGSLETARYMWKGGSEGFVGDWSGGREDRKQS